MLGGSGQQNKQLTTDGCGFIARVIPRILLSFVLFAWAAASHATSYNVSIQSEQLSNEQKNTLLHNLSLHRQRESAYLTIDYIERLYQKGVEELVQGLRVYGYYKAIVTSEIDKQEEAWQIQYTVDAGPALKIRNLDIQISGEGDQEEEVQRWQRELPIKPGDDLNQQLYEQSRDAIRQILVEQGYFDTQLVKRELRISLQQYYADIVLHVETGSRYRFGEVEFHSDRFSARYLNGFVDFEVGEVYDAGKLTQLQRNLLRSGEFSKITITPRVQQSEQGRVPINITLTARKPLRYSIGLGFGSDTGLRGRIGAQRRQITEDGNRADIELFLSGLRREVSGNYYIPLTRSITDYVSVNARYLEEETDDTFSRSNSVSINYVQALRHWQRTFTVTYLHETFEVSDEPETSQLLIPGVNFTWIPTHPGELQRNQLRSSTQLKASHEDLASDTSFSQVLFKVNGRLPVNEKLALVSRFDIGMSAIDDFDRLPVSQRFFAGGDHSVRGYAYHSLGPEDDQGDVVGGERLLVGSAELQYQFDQDWDFDLFYDAGNAFNRDNTHIKRGAGLGFGYLLPIGSLRAYAANALDADDQSWRLHITVGAQW